MPEAPATLDDGAIRDLLPHTWHAFFGRFGRLRPVQRLAVPELVKGLDTLVMAPTAAGKTEAIVAPLLERALTAHRRSALGLAVAIVSPTRALCNDLDRRLRGPVKAVGLTLDRKTGDSPSFDADKPPNLLITTPESLDSLLCRQTVALRELGAVMLDEVHLLDGGARGDQVRCLLARLLRVTRGDLLRCGASATIPDVESVARRYLGPEATWVVATEGAEARRRIESRAVEVAGMAGVADAVAALYAEAPRRKVLVFANRRAEVELLVAELSRRPRLKGRVFAHHGSLARGERLRVESRFLDAPSAICVATTTLEIGIDIGDVDRVVLLGPPPDVSSLLQRVGRGNRQAETVHALCVHDSPFDGLRFEHLIACAEAGQLFSERVGLRPSVVAQQGLSLLFQSPSGWISAKALWDRLPPEARQRYSEADCDSLLGGLAEKGYVRRVQHGRVVADVEGQRAFERGRLHSNLLDSPELEVVDELTGRAIGSIRLSRSQQDAAKAGSDLALSLAGRKRTVTRVADRQVVVRSDEGAETTQFMAKQAPRYSRGLAQSLARFVGLEPNVLLVEQLSADTWRIGHFLGTVWGRLLGSLLGKRGLKKGRRGGGPFFVKTKAPLTEALLRDHGALGGDLDELVESDLSRLASLLGPGPFARAVPKRLLAEWVRDAVRPHELAELLTSMRLVEGTLSGTES